jgi:hypothetical protein
MIANPDPLTHLHPVPIRIRNLASNFFFRVPVLIGWVFRFKILPAVLSACRCRSWSFQHASRCESCHSYRQKLVGRPEISKNKTNQDRPTASTTGDCQMLIITHKIPLALQISLYVTLTLLNFLLKIPKFRRCDGWEILFKGIVSRDGGWGKALGVVD